MSNKGFTLVELITTFMVSSVIIILLINIVVSIQEIYSKSNIKTELYINQANLSKAINSKFVDGNVTGYSVCSKSDFCYTFSLKNGETIDLVVTDSKISFGNFVYNLDIKSRILNPSLDFEYINESSPVKYNSFLIIKIPITSDYYNNIDFGVNMIYPYNSRIIGM